MANFKFFNIAKANAEIDRLTVALSEANTKITELAENEPTISAALQGEITQLKASNTDLSSRLSAAESKAAELEKKAVEIDASVEARASEKALAITQAQGQPAPLKASQTPAQDPVAEYMAETDPVKRAQLFKKHYKAIVAAAFKK